MFIARQGLWRYLVMPLLVDGVLAGGGLWCAFRFLRHRPLLHDVLAAWPTLAWVVAAILGVLLGAAAYLVVQPVATAPFCDLLSEKVEELVRGERPRIGFAVAAARAVLHGVLKLGLYAVALGVGLAFTALTGLGGPLVGSGLAVIFLAYDGFDYPLARRGASFAAKWRYLAAHPGLALGYGLATMLLYLVPLANLVAPPVAAAGATLAFLDAEPPPRQPAVAK